jgi:hypothetical protein
LGDFSLSDKLPITEYVCGATEKVGADACSLHGCTGERMRVWIFGRPKAHKIAKMKAQLCLRGIAFITSQGCLVRIDTPSEVPEPPPTEEDFPFLDESECDDD